MNKPTEKEKIEAAIVALDQELNAPDAQRSGQVVRAEIDALQRKLRNLK